MKEDENKEEEEPSAVALPSFDPPPPLEPKRDDPKSDGRFGVRFTSKLIVPPNLADIVNDQERRRRERRRLEEEGEAEEEHESLDEVLAAYD